MLYLFEFVNLTLTTFIINVHNYAIDAPSCPFTSYSYTQTLYPHNRSLSLKNQDVKKFLEDKIRKKKD